VAPVLPPEIHNRIDAERRNRHFSNEMCPWTTVAAALETIEVLLPGTDGCGRAILEEYREHLID
jgi:hypothetical protein